MWKRISSVKGELCECYECVVLKLLDAWHQYEEVDGSEASLGKVEKLMPRKVTKRKQVTQASVICVAISIIYVLSLINVLIRLINVLIRLINVLTSLINVF